jgi:hypothetical protein
MNISEAPFSDRVLVSCSIQDKEILRTLASLDGDVGMSGVVRRLLRAEARKRGLLPPEAGESQENPSETQ